MTNIARGPRGAYNPGRGDLCGAKFIANTDQKADREAATRNTRNALASEAVVLVSVPGGRTFAVPAEVHAEIIAQVEEQLARGVSQ